MFRYEASRNTLGYQPEVLPDAKQKVQAALQKVMAKSLNARVLVHWAEKQASDSALFSSGLKGDLRFVVFQGSSSAAQLIPGEKVSDGVCEVHWNPDVSHHIVVGVAKKTKKVFGREITKDCYRSEAALSPEVILLHEIGHFRQWRTTHDWFMEAYNSGGDAIIEKIEADNLRSCEWPICRDLGQQIRAEYQHGANRGILPGVRKLSKSRLAPFGG